MFIKIYFKRPLETPEEQVPPQPTSQTGSRLPVCPLSHGQVLCSNDWKYLLDSATQKFRHSSRKVALNTSENTGYTNAKSNAMVSPCFPTANVQNRNSFDFDERNFERAWVEKQNALDVYFNVPNLGGMSNLSDEHKSLGFIPEDNRILGQYLVSQRAAMNFER